MSIWHWLVIAAFVGIVVALVWRMRKRATAPDDLTQVQGWLALLVAGLTFLGPLIGLGRLSSDISGTESQYPQLLLVENWATYKNAVWVTFGLATLISIYAGSRLGWTRKRSAVKVALAALWLAGPLAATVLAVIIPSVIFNSDAVEAQAITGILQSIIGAAVWTAYLLRSKRVKARFVEGGPLPAAASATTAV